MPKSPAGAKTKTKIKEGDLVIVKWQDACVRGGWEDKAVYKNMTPVECASAGWVVANTASHITVIQTVCDNQLSGSMTIPKTWIVKIRKVL